MMKRMTNHGKQFIEKEKKTFVSVTGNFIRIFHFFYFSNFLFSVFHLVHGNAYFIFCISFDFDLWIMVFACCCMNVLKIREEDEDKAKPRHFPFFIAFGSLPLRLHNNSMRIIELMFTFTWKIQCTFAHSINYWLSIAFS